MAPKLRVLVYTLDLPRYACAQLRILQIASCFPQEVKLLWGVRSDGTDYAIDDSLVNQADLILFQRYFPMAGTRPVVERALASGTPIVYECDDDFLDIPEGHPMRERLAGNLEHIEYLARRAHAVTTTTEELASRFKEFSRDVRVLPNLLDPGLWGLGSEPARVSKSGLCVGVSGTASHLDDLAIIRPALEHVAQKYRGGVRLFFYGLLPEWAARLPGVESLPFDDDYVRYAKRLRRLDLDLALVPLADTPFNRCKSAIKYLEYAACAVPGVFSKVAPYAQTVEHGRTGLLAGPDPQHWIEAVDRLAARPRKTARPGPRCPAAGGGRVRHGPPRQNLSRHLESDFEPAGDDVTSFDWKKIPAGLQQRLLCGGWGFGLLLDNARLALACAGDEPKAGLFELGLSLMTAAWECSPLNGTLAASLLDMHERLPFLPEPQRETLRLTAGAWHQPENLGYMERLHEMREHGKLHDYLESQHGREPENLFWFMHCLDVCQLLGDWERVRELAAALPPELASVRSKYAGDAAFMLGEYEDAATLYARHPPCFPVRPECGAGRRCCEPGTRLRRPRPGGRIWRPTPGG